VLRKLELVTLKKTLRLVGKKSLESCPEKERKQQQRRRTPKEGKRKGTGLQSC